MTLTRTTTRTVTLIPRGGDEDIAFDGSDEDGMAIDEDMLASMTDEEIEEYFNKLYGEEENADGENADAADADAAFAE